MYFIALSMLRIAGEKITKVLDKLWSANSIIMWINRLWLSIKKTEENKQNQKNAKYLFSQHPVSVIQPVVNLLNKQSATKLSF